MATIITKTVKPSGGDYTSLSAWEAGEQGDLIGVRDEISVAECYSMSDTTAVVIDGWTTDATRYIKVYTPTSERHVGVWDTGKYNLVASVSGAGVLTIYEQHTYVVGLQIRNTVASPSGADSALRFIPSGSGVVYAEANICRGGRYTLRAESTNTTYNFWNNTVYENTVGACGKVYGTGVLYSNTFIGTTYGITNVNGNLTAKNCYAKGSTAYNGTITKTTCASSDTTGSAGLQNIAYDTNNFTNVTSGSEDLHIPSGSALVNVGTDTSGESAPLNFTTDIDGETRSGTWDIGADEYVAAGGTATIQPKIMGRGITPVGFGNIKMIIILALVLIGIGLSIFTANFLIQEYKSYKDFRKEFEEFKKIPMPEEQQMIIKEQAKIIQTIINQTELNRKNTEMIVNFLNQNIKK